MRGAFVVDLEADLTLPTLKALLDEDVLWGEQVEGEAGIVQLLDIEEQLECNCTNLFLAKVSALLRESV